MSGEWGYCCVCAFEVPVADGVLVPHGRGVHDIGKAVECPGGTGRAPTPQPGPEAKPIKLVNLKKSHSYIMARRRRHADWVRARAEADRKTRELRGETEEEGCE